MKKVIVFILALMLVFSSSISSFASDSYTELFSKEGTFNVADNTINQSTYLYSDEDTGHLYSYNIETEEETLIYKDNITDYYVHEEYIYCVINGNKIIRINANGTNPKEMIVTNLGINQIYANDDIIYYSTDNSIYQYYISSKTNNCIVNDENIYFFFPCSNIIVEWNTIDNYRNIKQKNIQTNQIDIKDAFSFDNSININTTRASTVYIHGKRIPKTDYPNLSYYSDNSSACNCHDLNSCCDSETSCNCKTYKGLDGIYKYQCRAFAAEMYNYIWGTSNYSLSNLTQRNIDSTLAARNYIRSLPTGSLIDAETIYGPHAFILAGFTDTGVTIYEANWPSNCQVRYITLSYSDFNTFYKYFNETYIGNHTYSSTYSYSSQYHWKNCSMTTCNGSSPYVLHSFTNTGGINSCFCGYVATTSKGIN